jgi:hypothetical protein
MLGKNEQAHSIQVSHKLDDIIEKGVEISRNNILEAEEIKYKKNQKETEAYDEFGFMEKYKDEYQKKK